MCGCLKIEVPEAGLCLTPGCRVKLGRFESTVWVVSYGWYAWGGNREVCGWYLTNLEDVSIVKPLQRPDLCDIYMIQN